MKIAILGYGKMGKIIDQLATSDGHEIVLRIGADNLDDLTPEALRRADVAIEFSVPEAACGKYYHLSSGESTGSFWHHGLARPSG
jgi:4-hydroxy-tetrahydrodipicolinate reductase